MSLWFKTRDPAVSTPSDRRSRVTDVAAPVSTHIRSPGRPQLIAEPPPFDRAPDGALLPAGIISGDTNEVNVTAGYYHLFVFVPADPADPLALAPRCEVDFFEAGDSPQSHGARCAHYTLALPSANSDGRYHAFRVISPKAAATAVARFVSAGQGSDAVLASPTMYFVPTTTLTYAATDADNNRHFCPIPIGRLHCYFATPSQCLYKIVAEFETERSAAHDGNAPLGMAIYQSMWGTYLDVRAKAQNKTAEPTNISLKNSPAEYSFRATGVTALIDVDFTDLSHGAFLKQPLTPMQTGPEYPAEYLAITDDFFESRYLTSKAAFSRLKFPEAELTAHDLIASPRIIAIAGEYLNSHLSILSGFTAVTEQNAMEVLNNDGAKEEGIILVESLFHRQGQSWKTKGTTPITEDPLLQELLRIAGRRGWTRVFWFSEDRLHLNAFSFRLGLFDRIINEAISHEKDAVEFPDEITICLPFVDLRLANPFLSLQPRRRLHRFIREARRPLETKTLVVGWADLLEGTGLDEIFDDASLRHIHICEDLWKFRANKVDDFPRLASNIVGFLAPSQLISAYKRYGAALFFYPSLRSDTQLIRNVMLAASCNCLPIIYCGGRRPQASSLIDELAIITEDPDELRQLMDQLGEDGLELLRRRHLIWRSAASCNSSGRSLMAALGVREADLPHRAEDLLVSIVTPTKRPEFLMRAYEQICEQQHPTWEWIIVLNRRDTSPSQLPEAIRTNPRVRILTAAPSKNIGFCLELGIAVAKGALWVKWDDDDFYGPGYLGDTVLLSRMTKAELIGRPPGYLYYERNNGLFRRPGAVLAFIFAPEGIWPGGIVSGASLSGRVDGHRLVGFEFDWRSSVDSDYIDAVAASGASICSGPNFGLVAFRAADPALHTWRAPEAVILENAEQVGGDRELRVVLA